MGNSVKKTELSSKFDLINKKAATLSLTPQQDQSVFQSLRSEIIGQMLMLEEYYFSAVKRMCGNFAPDDDVFANLYLDSILECLKKYNLQKAAKFTTYFKMILNYRLKDKLKRQVDSISFDMLFENADGDKANDLYNKYESAQSTQDMEAIEGRQMVERILSRYIMYVIELLSNLYEKKNHTLVLYYKMFYTSHLVDIIKNEPTNDSEICTFLKAHERETFSSAECALINFTYTVKTGTIDEIYFNTLKRYNQIPCIDEKSKSDKCIDIPYRNKILLAYLACEYNKVVSDAMISKMKKKFSSLITAAQNNV